MYLFSLNNKNNSNRFNIIRLLIAVLLFNIVMPTLASITSPNDKLLICSQNGFEWVSVNQKELEYLALAKQLNLDVEQIWGDDLPTTDNTPPHGKCVLCYFEPSDLAAIVNGDWLFTPPVFNSVVSTSYFSDLYTKGKYVNPPSRAPPRILGS